MTKHRGCYASRRMILPSTCMDLKGPSPPSLPAPALPDCALLLTLSASSFENQNPCIRSESKPAFEASAHVGSKRLSCLLSSSRFETTEVQEDRQAVKPVQKPLGSCGRNCGLLTTFLLIACGGVILSFSLLSAFGMYGLLCFRSFACWPSPFIHPAAMLCIRCL